jgi:excisionase family DNA binding protein
MKLLGPKELGETLDVDVTTIYGWIARKQITYYKINNLVKFDFDENKSWLESKRVRPYSENIKRQILK